MGVEDFLEVLNDFQQQKVDTGVDVDDFLAKWKASIEELSADRAQTQSPPLIL